MCRKTAIRNGRRDQYYQNVRSFNATPGSEQVDLAAQVEQPLQLLVTVIYQGRTLQGDDKISDEAGTIPTSQWGVRHSTGSRYQMQRWNDRVRVR